MGRNRGSRRKSKGKNRGSRGKNRGKKEPWPPTGNETTEKCIAEWEAKGYDWTRDVRILPLTLKQKQIMELSDGRFELWYESHDRDKIKYVLGKINALAKRHGEEYVFREIVKSVTSTKGRVFSVTTFNVIERTTYVLKTVEAFMYEDHVRNPFADGVERFDLREWRFKPGFPEAPFGVYVNKDDFMSPKCSESSGWASEIEDDDISPKCSGSKSESEAESEMEDYGVWL